MKLKERFKIMTNVNIEVEENETIYFNQLFVGDFFYFVGGIPDELLLKLNCDKSANAFSFYSKALLNICENRKVIVCSEALIKVVK